MRSLDKLGMTVGVGAPCHPERSEAQSKDLTRPPIAKPAMSPLGGGSGGHKVCPKFYTLHFTFYIRKRSPGRLASGSG